MDTGDIASAARRADDGDNDADHTTEEILMEIGGCIEERSARPDYDGNTASQDLFRSASTSTAIPLPSAPVRVAVLFRSAETVPSPIRRLGSDDGDDGGAVYQQDSTPDMFYHTGMPSLYPSDLDAYEKSLPSPGAVPRSISPAATRAISKSDLPFQSFPRRFTPWGSGGDVWEDVSPDLAQKVQKWRQSDGGSTTAPKWQERPQRYSQTGPSGSNVAGTIGPTTVTTMAPFSAGSSSPASSRMKGGIFKISGAVPPGTENTISAFFILLCVPCGWFGAPQLKYREIEVPIYQHDDAFFRDLRNHYESLRGFLQNWFHPRQFSFCHASRFEKWYAGRLGWACHEMPPDQATYEYIPKPPPVPYASLLTKHEWQDRFHCRINTQGLREAIMKLPKKTGRFDISTGVKREFVWGLHAQLRISAVVVLLWTAVISLGGWAFMVWWLLGHSGDLQNAAVPISLILGPLMMFWLLLNERFKDDT